MAVSLRERPSTRYAAAFRAGFQATARGAIVVEQDRLLLEGQSDQGHVELSIPYVELDEVRIGRLPEERLNERAALLLSRRDGELVRVEPLELGLLHELADLLSALAREQADEHEIVAVVLPLRKGRLSQARKLVSSGPPFDPAALGLRRHEVFLTEREAVFVFEGPRVRRMLERLTRDPTLWQAGLAWRNCVGGRPRFLAEAQPMGGTPAYSWAAFGPTG